jgi:hypothetical protein
MWFLWMIAACSVVFYWKQAVFALICFLAYKAVRWELSTTKRRIAAQREAERQRIKRLRRNATREHRWVQEGRVAGVYGDYPPPEDCEGIGIWLTDK